jgi:nitric oxide reductase subunit C
MGCHTLLGEGAYYAPELTKVFERRGPAFIRAMLTDPEKMYPGQRRMWKYDFTERDKDDLIAFFEWIGKVDLNGFPPKPTLAQSPPPAALATTTDRPQSSTSCAWPATRSAARAARSARPSTASATA